MKLFALGISLLILLAPIDAAAKKKQAKKKVNPKLFLTIEKYLDIALEKSDTAKTAFNNFQNSINTFKSSYRQSRLPSASATSSISKSKSDVESAVTWTESANGSLSLSQPIYPTGADVSASVSESVTRTEASGVLSRSDTKPSYSATLTQPLFIFKGNTKWRSWKRSRISYEIEEDNYRRTLQTIQNEARSNYFDVLRKREEVEVERHKLKASERAHKITKLLVRAGRYAGIDLSRSDVRLKRDRRRLDNAETEFQKSINDALEFAGLPIGTKYKFISKLDYEKLDLNLDRLLEFAFLHRPDYIAARKRMELSEISVKEAKEADNPSFDAVGTLTRTDSQSLSGETTSKGWSGTLNLTWPFFDSRRTALQVKTAKNNLVNEKISFNGLKRNIEKEVKNAYLEVKRAETQIDDLKESKQQALKTVNVVRIRYKNGVDRLVDVFDSENELRALELEYLDALISANLAKDRLALEVGGSLEDVQ